MKEVDGLLPGDLIVAGRGGVMGAHVPYLGFARHERWSWLEPRSLVLVVGRRGTVGLHRDELTLLLEGRICWAWEQDVRQECERA